MIPEEIDCVLQRNRGVLGTKANKGLQVDVAPKATYLKVPCAGGADLG
jgi:hypothetical protein